MNHTYRRRNQNEALTELGAVLDRNEEAKRREAGELAQWATEHRGAWTEEYARTFSAEQRRKAAKEGAALPDGSYPIYNQQDADNAARAIGRGSAAESTIVAHIRKRVRQLSLKMPAVGDADADDA